MLKSIIVTLLLCLQSASADVSAPGSSINTPANDDLSSYKMPDALWAHLSDLTRQFSVAVSNQNPAARDFIPRIKACADEFTHMYPKSSHYWGAKMARADAEAKALRNQLAPAPAAAQVRLEYKAIAKDTTAPLAVRAEASSDVIDQAIDQACNDSGVDDSAWKSIDRAIVGFQKQFGSDYSPDGKEFIPAELREEELDALEIGPASARYQPLLEKLASDSEPKIAAMANRKLTAQKNLATLRTKPINLKFTAVDGTSIDLVKLRGKVVLIDFWATWCPDCRIDTPDVVAAYHQYHLRGFEIVGISLDKDKAKLLAFINRNGMTWPQYFDGQVWDNKISKNFGIDFIPAAWLLDKNGMLATTDGSGHLAEKVGKMLKAP